MASSDKKESRRTRWHLSTIIWIIVLILAAIFILYTFLKEMKNEEEYQKHREIEHAKVQ